MAMPLRMADDETEALHRRAEFKSGPYAQQRATPTTPPDTDASAQSTGARDGWRIED
jgi:hypothetical protein